MTPSQEERLAIIEQRFSDHQDLYHRHTATCADWQAQMNRKLDKIYRELNSRLPKWATVGAITVFSLMSAALGWLARGA